MCLHLPGVSIQLMLVSMLMSCEQGPRRPEGVTWRVLCLRHLLQLSVPLLFMWMAASFLPVAPLLEMQFLWLGHCGNAQCSEGAGVVAGIGGEVRQLQGLGVC